MHGYIYIEREREDAHRDRLHTSMTAVISVRNFDAQLPGLRLPPSMDTSLASIHL